MDILTKKIIKEISQELNIKEEVAEKCIRNFSDWTRAALRNYNYPEVKWIKLGTFKANPYSLYNTGINQHEVETIIEYRNKLNHKRKLTLDYVEKRANSRKGSKRKKDANQ